MPDANLDVFTSKLFPEKTSEYTQTPNVLNTLNSTCCSAFDKVNVICSVPGLGKRLIVF